MQFMLPSNKVCNYICGLSNKFFNFKAINVLVSCISYDKMFYTFAGSEISTILTSSCCVELKENIL